MEIRTDTQKVMKFLNDHGYSYNSLARKLNCGPSNLQNQLLKRAASPAAYIRIAAVLGVSIDDLFRVIFPDDMETYFPEN